MTDSIEDTAPHGSNARLFLGPAILTALAVACFIGVGLLGVGPCGGAGFIFILPFFAFAAGAIVWFLVSCVRAVARGRTTEHA